MFPAKRTYHTHFRPGTTKKRLFRGYFCFYALNVMHVLDPFFFSDQAMVLEDLSHIIYSWSYLASQTGFALKIALKY